MEDASVGHKIIQVLAGKSALPAVAVTCMVMLTPKPQTRQKSSFGSSSKGSECTGTAVEAPGASSVKDPVMMSCMPARQKSVYGLHAWYIVSGSNRQDG